MNRFGAFAVHLGISLLIFLVLGYIIVAFWYPDFFFTADGGWQGIRIVALVDLVLGPMLTLVVYKKGKPSLKFDLTAIAVFQAACLTAGVWVVWSERPVAMVYADGSFQTMTIDDYREVDKPVPDFGGYPDAAPHWVSVKLPDDLEAQSTARRAILVGGRSLKTATEFYVPFRPDHVDPNREGLTDQELERLGMDIFKDFARQHGGEVGDYIFLPFTTRYEQALMAMRKEGGELIYVHIDTEGLD